MYIACTPTSFTSSFPIPLSRSPLTMNSHMLHTNTLSFPFPALQFHTKRTLPFTNPPPTLTFLHKSFLHLDPLRSSLSPNSKGVRGLRFDGPVMDIGELSGIEEGDLVVETCITRTLPPALTLEHGLQKIKEAVEDLKLNPPCSSSGILRFQVAVSPSAKALNWFCCQPESSEVFPLFFLSKEDNPTCKSLALSGTRGVFGIGAAIYFSHSSSCNSGERSSIKRYLSNDSTLITTYGFMDICFDTESSSLKHEPGSFYFFIPQIELDEYEGLSILVATLAWSDSYLCTFEKAIVSYELSLNQASRHFWPTTEKCHTNCIRSALKKLNVADNKNFPMVYINALTLGGRDFVADTMELKGARSSCQFCLRLSPTVAVSSNM